MKVCPICGKVIGFNSYFGAYICDECEWEDDSYNQERIEFFAHRNLANSDEETVCEEFSSSKLYV